MENIKTSLTLDKKTREEAQKLFDEMGLSFSAAVDIFLKAVIREKGIPFPIMAEPMKSGYVYGVVELPPIEECDNDSGGAS